MGKHDYIDEMTPAEFDNYMLRHKRAARAMGWPGADYEPSRGLAVLTALMIVAFIVAIVIDGAIK